MNERRDRLDLVAPFEADFAGLVEQQASSIGSRAAQEMYRSRANQLINVAKVRLRSEEVERERALGRQLLSQRRESILRNGLSLNLDHDTVREQLRLATTHDLRSARLSAAEVASYVNSGIRDFSLGLASRQNDEGNYHGLLGAIQRGHLPGLTAQDQEQIRGLALAGIRRVTTARIQTELEENPIAARRMAWNARHLLPEQRIALVGAANATLLQRQRATKEALIRARAIEDPETARREALGSSVLRPETRIGLAAQAEAILQARDQDTAEARARALIAKDPAQARDFISRSQILLPGQKVALESAADQESREIAWKDYLLRQEEAPTDVQRMDVANTWISENQHLLTPGMVSEAYRFAIMNERDRAVQIGKELAADQDHNAETIEAAYVNYEYAARKGDPRAADILMPFIPEGLDVLHRMGKIDTAQRNQLMRRFLDLTKISEKELKIQQTKALLESGLIRRPNAPTADQKEALERIYQERVMQAGEAWDESADDRFIATQGYMPEILKEQITGDLLSTVPEKSAAASVRVTNLQLATPKLDVFAMLDLSEQQRRMVELQGQYVKNGVPVNQAVQFAQEEAKLVPTDETTRASRASKAFHVGLASSDPLAVAGEPNEKAADPHAWFRAFKNELNEFDWEEWGVEISDELVFFFNYEVVRPADFEAHKEFRTELRDLMRAHFLDTGDINVAARRSIQNLIGGGKYGLETALNGASTSEPMLVRYPTTGLPTVVLENDGYTITGPEYANDALFHGVMKPLTELMKTPAFPRSAVDTSSTEADSRIEAYRNWLQTQDGQNWALSNVEAAAFSLLNLDDPDVRRFFADVAEIGFKGSVAPFSVATSGITHALPLFPDVPPSFLVRAGDGMSDRVDTMWKSGIPPSAIVVPHPIQIPGEPPQYTMMLWNRAEELYSTPLMGATVTLDGSVVPSGVPISFTLDPSDSEMVRRARARDARTGIINEAHLKDFFTGDLTVPEVKQQPGTIPLSGRYQAMARRFARYPELADMAKADPALRRRLARELGTRASRSHALSAINLAADIETEGGNLPSELLRDAAGAFLDTRRGVEEAMRQLDEYLGTETK